jgi:hypothetical protein
VNQAKNPAQLGAEKGTEQNQAGTGGISDDKVAKIHTR